MTKTSIFVILISSNNISCCLCNITAKSYFVVLQHYMQTMSIYVLFKTGNCIWVVPSGPLHKANQHQLVGFFFGGIRVRCTLCSSH